MMEPSELFSYSLDGSNWLELSGPSVIAEAHGRVNAAPAVRPAPFGGVEAEDVAAEGAASDNAEEPARHKRKRVHARGTADVADQRALLWSELNPGLHDFHQPEAGAGSDLTARISWKPDPTKEELEQQARDLIERLTNPEQEEEQETWTNGTLARLRVQFGLVKLEKAPDTSLRSYQRELLATCVARDTICVMATGTGKTLIAVSLVNQLLEGKLEAKAFIICPTVLLVQQQALYFETNSPFNVAVFYGEIIGLESWRRAEWQWRIQTAQILCFTPTIALDALRHSFIELDKCAVVILDECHHANNGDHPMRQLMLQVAKTDPRPRILGLTASPLISVPKSGITAALLELERIMCGARLCTISVEQVPTLEQHFHVQQKKRPSLDEINAVFDKTPHGASVKVCLFSRLYRLRGDHLRIPFKKQRFVRQVVTRANHLAHNVSVRAGRNYLRRAGRKEEAQLYRPLLEGLRSVPLWEEEKEGEGDGACLKLLQLRALVRERIVHGKVLVFVEQREVTEGIAADLRLCLGINCVWVTGHASGALMEGSTRDAPGQLSAFQAFQSPNVPVLVSTATAEEGVDVSSVATVISYDGLKQVKSYIQMRGRCRSAGSLYIILTDDDQQKDCLENARAAEQELKEFIAKRSEMDVIHCDVTDERGDTLGPGTARFRDTYVVPATGAQMSEASCVSLLSRFAQMLGQDEPLSMSVVRTVNAVTGEEGYVGSLSLSNQLPEDLRWYSSDIWHRKKDCMRQCCFKLHVSRSTRFHRAVMALQRSDPPWIGEYLMPVSAATLLGLRSSSLPPEVPLSREQEELEEAVMPVPVSAIVNRVCMVTPALAPDTCFLVSFHFELQYGLQLSFKIWIPFEVSQSLSFPLFHHRAGRVEVTVNHLPESEPPSEEDLRASHILWCSVMYADKVMFPIMLEQRLRTQVIERKRLFDALELEDEDPTADYLWRSRSPELETHLYAVYGQSEDTTMTSLMERDGTSFAQHYEQQGLPCPPSMMQELLWEAHEVRLRTKSRLYMEGMPVPARRRVVHLPAYAFRSHWCRRDVCCATQLLPSVIRTIRSLHACDGALAVLQKGLLQQTLPFNALELRVALTPAAAGMPFSLERLEFIGDSVLKMLVSRLAFCDFPYNEGLLTELRRAIVANETLCSAFLQSPLAGFVDPQPISAWPKLHDKVPIRAKACADILEAVIGCAWLASKDVMFVERLARFLGVFVKIPLDPAGSKRTTEATAAPLEWTAKVESMLGYKFANPALLMQALTHSSCSHSRLRSQSYDRLEFLGDAVLDVVAADAALQHSQNSPSALTNFRSHNTSTECLALVCQLFGLHKCLRHNSSGLAAELPRYVSESKSRNLWVANAPKVMADIVEALIGAVFVDCGFDWSTTMAFAKRLCIPIWDLTVPPPLEPCRLLQERIGAVVQLSWRAFKLHCNSRVIDTDRTRNWRRMCAHHLNSMLDAYPDLRGALLEIPRKPKLSEEEQEKTDAWIVVSGGVTDDAKAAPVEADDGAKATLKRGNDEMSGAIGIGAVEEAGVAALAVANDESSPAKRLKEEQEEPTNAAAQGESANAASDQELAIQQMDVEPIVYIDWPLY